MKKFLIGPITGIMEKRKNLIAQQFKDAETVQNQAQEMKTQYETALSGAKEESAATPDAVTNWSTVPA
mgnify:CR=1 FL=1